VAEELGRFLDGRPILARPLSRAERVWRWGLRRPAVAALLVAVSLSLGSAGWLGWQAVLTSRQLAQERMQGEIRAALDAALRGDSTPAERAIAEAKRHGAPDEWVHMLDGQIALYSMRPDRAVPSSNRRLRSRPET
jgi:hypothetical protein